MEFPAKTIQKVSTVSKKELFVLCNVLFVLYVNKDVILKAFGAPQQFLDWVQPFLLSFSAYLVAGFSAAGVNKS